MEQNEKHENGPTGPGISMGVFVGTALGAALGGYLFTSTCTGRFSSDLGRLRKRVRELRLSLLTEELRNQQAQ